MSSEDESSSSDDDVPLAALVNNSKRPARGRQSTQSYNEESDEFEFDDEDDAPVSNLKSPKPAAKKRKPPAKKTTPKKKGKTETKKKAEPKKKKTVKKSESVSIFKSSSTAITVASELYAKSKKGKLISEFLSRWWYAMSWPDLDSKAVTEVPPNCDAFDGFPGVFVTTSGEDVGKIIDKRDPATCPSFANMVRKTSEELQTLLLKAIEEQRRVLIESEGKDTQTEKDLRSLEKWTEKVNPKAADKEAEKVLKAASLKIV